MTSHRHALRHIGGQMRLTPGRMTLGRSQQCDLCLPDATVSRLHAELHVTADEVRIEDVGSRHGVTVRGEEVTTPRVLRHGDDIRLGRVGLTFIDLNEVDVEEADTGAMQDPSYVAKPEDPDDPRIGRTIDGTYTIVEIIGQGGMGRVYRAEQQALGRSVALKVVHENLAGESGVVARFYNEARAASRLNHPNSVSVYDFGRTPDGLLYLVMEYVDGVSLDHRLGSGALTLERAAHIASEVLAALSEAHRLGIVHRDLKPENVMLRPRSDGPDVVKVVDFGLARLGDDAPITRPGHFLGTPEYVSPEHAEGGAVDGRSDLYSVGILLYELITGVRPYEDESPVRVLWAHKNEPVPDPRREIAVPDAIAEVVVRALQKDPAARYQTADEFRTALRGALEVLRGRMSAEHCPACGAGVTPDLSYCRSCGVRLRKAPRAGGTAQTRSATMTPFAYRDIEIEWVDHLLAHPEREPTWIHVHGEQGVGRSRLLQEIAVRARAAGEVVASGGPHPSGAAVPYAALQSVAAQLLGIEPAQLRRAVAEDPRLSDPLVRAGGEELFSPRGLERTTTWSRAGSVARLLQHALVLAMADSAKPRAVVLVDDYLSCDGLTHQAVEELLDLAPGLPLLVITSGDRDVPGATVSRHLEGFTRAEARRFLDGLDVELPDGDAFPPLYLELLSSAVDGLPAGQAPPGLAGVVSLHLDRLDFRARRLLQAAAVLGDSCDERALERMTSAEDLRFLEVLLDERLVRVAEGRIHVAHPFVRELVESSIPDGARRALHDRALSLSIDQGEPLEVRAAHAWRGTDVTSALLLLERLGREALSRGDPRSATVALQRALDLARRELWRTGDPELEWTTISLGRKLGEALARDGEVLSADGVLRETLNAVGPAHKERSLVLLALAEAATERGRTVEPLLMEALRLCEANGDRAVAGLAWFALARNRRDRDDLPGASRDYLAASERLEGATRAEALLERAETLRELGELEDSALVIDLGVEVARSCQATSLVAMAMGCRGQLLLALDKIPEARRLFDSAAELAARSGDLFGHRRWLRAAGRPSP